jgi:hypothetical protein
LKDSQVLEQSSQSSGGEDSQTLTSYQPSLSNSGNLDKKRKFEDEPTQQTTQQPVEEKPMEEDTTTSAQSHLPSLIQKVRRCYN